MIDFAVIDRGSCMWRTCQRSGYLAPSRARSGQMRREPHRNGWSYTDSPGFEYSPNRSVSQRNGRIICEWQLKYPSRMYRSRPASSSGVYGFTDAMVGMFDLIRNVGMISNSDATAIATSTHTLKNSQRPSHMRCQPRSTMRASTPAGTVPSSLLVD